jgi:hypothetical protein
MTLDEAATLFPDLTKKSINSFAHYNGIKFLPPAKKVARNERLHAIAIQVSPNLSVRAACGGNEILTKTVRYYMDRKGMVRKWLKAEISEIAALRARHKAEIAALKARKAEAKTKPVRAVTIRTKTAPKPKPMAEIIVMDTVKETAMVNKDRASASQIGAALGAKRVSELIGIPMEDLIATKGK